MQAAMMEMIEAGGRTAQTFGLNRLLGQIYAYLYLSPEARCLDCIADELGVSKASVSIACRQLQAWGALHRVWQRGDRRDYYQAESDFRTILRNGILPSVNKKLDSAQIQIERSKAMLDRNGDGNPDRAFLEKRLKEAERFRDNMARLLDNPLVRKWI